MAIFEITQATADCDGCGERVAYLRGPVEVVDHLARMTVLCPTCKESQDAADRS